MKIKQKSVLNDPLDKFYAFTLLFIVLLVILIAWLTVPHGKQCYGPAPWYLNCDYSLWFEASKNFPFAFKYGNILVHRPFFAGIGALFYVPTRLFLNLVGRGYVTDLKVFVLTWRLQNILFYLGLVAASFEVGRRLWNKRVGFFLALLVATNAHVYAWLMQPLNNIQGFFITFASWWMVIDWHEESKALLKAQKFWGYSLIIGILMLGKALYNIPATILFLGLFVYRKYNLEAVFSLLLQAIPTIFWILFVTFVLKTEFKNYEARFGIFYFVKQYFMNINSPIDLYDRLVNVARIPIDLGLRGVGLAATALGFVYLGIEKTRIRTTYIFYILFTTGLLFASSFALVRHAPDYWPVYFVGTAVISDSFIDKFAKSKQFYLVVLFILIIFVNMVHELSPGFLSSRSVF